jgi:hypothetical protein
VTFNPQCSFTQKQATCTEWGFETWTCSHDPSHTLVVNEMKPLGHNYARVVTKPTYTQSGYTTNTCTRCGDSFTSDPTPKLVIPSYPTTLSLRYHQATSVFSDIARQAPDLVWKSSNEKVLKIDRNGLVTYPKRARGESTVTGSLDGETYVTVKVTVKIVWWQGLIIIILFGWIWY